MVVQTAAASRNANNRSSYRQTTNREGRVTETITKDGKVTSRRDITNIPGGGRSSPQQPQPEVPTNVQPALEAAAKGQTAAPPQSIAELIQRREAIRNASRQTGKVFTQTEARRALGGAVQGTNITASRAANLPGVSQYVQQLRAGQAQVQVQNQSQNTPPPQIERQIIKDSTGRNIVVENGRIVNTVSRFDAPTNKLDRLYYMIEREKGEYKTTKARSGQTSVGAEIKQAGLGIASAGVGTLLFGRSIFTNPVETVKNIPSGIKQSAESFGEDVQSNPSFALGNVAGNILIGKATSKASGKAVTVAENIVTVVDPRFSPIIKSATEQSVAIPPRLGASRINLVRPGQLGDLSLAQQASFGGKTVAAVSAQRGLFGLFEQRKTIDKPLPTPDAPPLERAMFFSPPNIKTGAPELRISRLGLKENPPASFLDLVGGRAELTLRRNRPQAIILPNAKIAPIPAALQSLLEKAKQGDPVAIAEFERRFLEYQLKPTGDLQPIGFASTREAELTLAPGSVLAKKGIPVITLIQGKRVPIVETEIVKPSVEASVLIDKLTKEGLSLTEKNKLRDILQKETGLDYSYEIEARARVPIESGLTLFRSSPEVPTKPYLNTYSTVLRGGSQPAYSTSRTTSAAPSPKTIRPPITFTDRVELIQPNRPPARSGVSNRLLPSTYRPPINFFGPPKSSKTKLPSSDELLFSKKIDVNLITAFKTFIIKNRKKVYLKGTRDYGSALKLGSDKTLTDTSATFGVESAGFIKGRDTGFRPNPKAFRDYRIKDSKKYKLDNIFIQRTSTEGGEKKGRLGRPTEVRDLLSFRSKSNKKFKFF